jgi:hypothetical protein
MIPEVYPMIVPHRFLFAALVLVAGCSDAQQGGGQPPNGGQPPPKEGWEDKKMLAELAPKIRGLKENLRRLQTDLNEREPQKFASREIGDKKWRPHEDYLSDPNYKMFHLQLTSILKTYNSIVDRNPDLKMSRLNESLE